MRMKKKLEKNGNYGRNAQRANHSFSSDYFNLLYFCAYFAIAIVFVCVTVYPPPTFVFVAFTPSQNYYNYDYFSTRTSVCHCRLTIQYIVFIKKMEKK